ncbi:MAG: ParB/RepB/Spo0J family partition protein [Candidatus Caldatribacterium sp.]|nr:ParB/RepB/Spo0J family partition protein [Candidatus Caldatribacterium sp.]
MTKRGLGRGLDALIPGAGLFGSRAIQEVEIEKLHPNSLQPRVALDEERLEELTESIRQHGVLQPILVRRSPQGFEIIAGERRWRAAQRAGLRTVPVIVEEEVDEEKKLELALVENLQREDLNPIELAQGIQKLIETFGLTQEEVAERIGKKRSTVANLLRLLELPEDIKHLVAQGTISPGHAKTLLGLPEEEQRSLLSEILSRSLSVRDTEKLARKKRERKEPQEEKEREEAHIENLLTHYLATRVRVGRGKITIEYYGPEDLRRIYMLIVRPE